jgi:transposase
VVEVGFKGFSTHRQLEAHHIHNLVVHPADVPTKDKERKQKRDRVDAKKLGRSLRAMELEGIYVPPVKLEQDRSIVRYRCENLVPKITRIKVQIRSFLNVNNRPAPVEFSGKRWTKAFRQWLQQVVFDQASADFTFKMMLTELDFYEKQLKEVERKLVVLSQDPAYAESVRLLRGVPGIGLLSALVFILELGDLRRFRNLEKLSAYVGLIPNVYGSAERIRVGRQTKRGNALVRRILTQCAWRARSADPALLHAYEELTKRMKPNKAIIRIQRRLLNRIRHILTHRVEYQIGVG